MKKIAIIGTGAMGHGMALNFLKKGYEVFLYNRNQEKLKDLLSLGGKVVASPKEATQKANIVFEVTSNDESSRSVWLGPDGIISGANKEKVLVTNATISADWVDELAEICEKDNLTFLDIPLTGGRTGAESGNLVFLAGGDKKILEEIKPDLLAIGTQIFHFGKTGSGMRLKLLLNMLQGIHMTAFGEVMNIAEKSKMDIEAVGQVFAERMGVTTALGWKYYGKNVDPINFSVELMAKDLSYAKKLAGKETTLMLNEALKKFTKLVEKGDGNKDWTIVNKI